MSKSWTTTLAVTLVLLASGCPSGRYASEGDDRGECSDGADNDRDGDFDCHDPDCDGSPDCADPDCDGSPDCDDGAGYDNVAACEAWLESMECGDQDFDGLVDCSIYAYENYPCNVADYFDCLAEEGECDEDLGIYDSSGWTDCVDLAACD